MLSLPCQLCACEARDSSESIAIFVSCVSQCLLLSTWKSNLDVDQDLEDTNPLIRALALRTISYIHVREFVQATVLPLANLLRDSDPYVRKTSAITVAKIYDHDRALVEKSDLIDRLNSMLRDDNPTVVSSALAALMDIWERSENIKLTIDYASASKIVQILPDCSEYVPSTSLSLKWRANAGL